MPAGDPPVQLLPDLRLMRLPMDEADAFQQACEPRHLRYDPVGDRGAHRYAFVRHPAPATTVQYVTEFDPNDVLHLALAVSRYVVRNSHCTEVAGRRIEAMGAAHPVMITALEPARRFYGWRVIEGSRAFLTQHDAHQLGPLLATLVRDRERLPPRVWHAMWFCEASFRTYYYDIASVHVVTALESLLKVRDYNAGAQFATRVPALARESRNHRHHAAPGRGFLPSTLARSPRASTSARHVQPGYPGTCSHPGRLDGRTAPGH
jgi:hypothetical protein